MADPVSLLVPMDVRFRAIGPELAGKFCAAVGGSDKDASSVSAAVSDAVEAFARHDEAGEAVTLEFTSSPGRVDVTLRNGARASVVSHQLSNTST